jgi:hypothetical protein
MKLSLFFLSFLAIGPTNGADTPFAPTPFQFEERPFATRYAVAIKRSLNIDHLEIADVDSLIEEPAFGRLPLGVRIDYGVPKQKEHMLDAAGFGYHWLDAPGPGYNRQRARDFDEDRRV